jgi:ATP adenylyltransferase
MRYISGGPSEDGCIFCNRLARANDLESLILHRAEHCFLIMNLFPYNTGHLMIVPNAHVAEIDNIEPHVIAEMARLLPPVVRALRRVLGCDGFNIGFNQGAIAGAGLAEHLHQHVVPRWQGDANFMPIIAGTMVIPELIPSTYAKVRNELDAEIHGVSRFEIILIDDADNPNVWLRDDGVPVVVAAPESPVWTSVVSSFKLQDTEFIGYSGAPSTLDRTTTPGLVIRTTSLPNGSGWRRVPFFSHEQADSISAGTNEILLRVRSNLAPWIDSCR